jgi:tRNA dimethylallyltransferase
MPTPAQKIIVVVGPTASGKTALALSLARRFGGEVINCDSRQIYREVEIGAAVEPGEWRVARRGRSLRRVWFAGGVRHHLTNFLSPALTMSAAEYKRLAVAQIRAVLRRGRLPILCGGTGLYASAVIENFSLPEVPPDEAFRAATLARPADESVAALAAADPDYAARAGRNPRYVVRALEVMRATGRTMTEMQQKGEPLFDALRLGVARPREELNERCERRFDLMMRAGLLEETRRLGERYGWQAPAATAIGHRQLGAFVRGEISLAEAVADAKAATRQYAKRQLTWFRRDSQIRWVEDEATAIELARRHLVGRDN